jgi:regulator of protease activity HflC (stomatin/prohibitin superfamily)
MVVLIPISFSYVEAGHVGLPENRISGNVDEAGKVYTMTLDQNGRYYLGPEKTIQPFDARVQQKVFALDVIASNSRGFKLHVVCFYRIKQSEVGLLFTKFTQNWKTPAQNEVVSTIKSIAPRFDIPDYVTNLSYIRSVMADELSIALNANHLVTVDQKFLILRADFTGDIDNQYLQTVVQVQTNERQLIQREVDIITQDTETQRQAILANKTLVEATGQANATRIVETARAEANKKQELARTAGFTELFDFFNVTNTTTKVAYLEWYALKNNLNRVTVLDGVNSVLVQTS